MVTKILLVVCLAVVVGNRSLAQTNNCTFRQPFFHLHFGKGNVKDVNTTSLAFYNRVASSCPTDGHYSYVSSTSNCFRGDWHTLTEDHTPGDAGGNMLLVNSAFDRGVFLTTRAGGFKAETTYEFGVWLMNVCKPTDKCPFPLLPNIVVRLQTPAGKTVAQFGTGEVVRRATPGWTQHRSQFTVPAATTELILTLTNTAPGGCGNDFVLDDITFRECVKTNPARVVEQKKVPPVVADKKVAIAKKEVKKNTPVPTPVSQRQSIVTVAKHTTEFPTAERPRSDIKPAAFVPAPLILKQRANPVARQIETVAGELQIDLYDNGIIDGDTVSIYHNNVLIVARQALSKKPINFRVQVNGAHPHHELIMVAENLGSIPPNTSLMIVTAKDKRYEVFISSTEQKNAKVVINLKE